MAFDAKSLSQDEKIIVGIGAAMIIVAFLPGYGADSGPYSVSVKVASMGFSAKMGLLFAILAAAWVVVRNAGIKTPDMPAGDATVTLGAAAIGLLFFLYRIIDLPGVSGPGFHVGRKWGLFVAVILSVVQTAVAYKRFQASGEKAPKLGGSSSS